MLKKGRKQKSKAEGLVSACILPAFHINYSSSLPGLHLPSTLPYQPVCAVVDKERLGLCSGAVWLSSLHPEPKDMRPLIPVPTTCKEQNIPAPLGLFSGARQSPKALAKGGSKSPSASTAQPNPQQLELKAPVLGELLDSTSHLLKANTAGL